MGARKTVGKIATDLKKNEKYNTHSPKEQMREQLKDYDENLYKCLHEGKKALDGDFFVVVITKKERILDNVLRNYFLYRCTCPTPEWDQAVYKYHRQSDHIEFLWVVPSKDTCNYMIDNAITIDKDQRELLNFVLDFNDGTLLQRAKNLNSEGVNVILTSDEVKTIKTKGKI